MPLQALLAVCLALVAASHPHTGQQQPLVASYRRERSAPDPVAYYHTVKAALGNNRFVPDWEHGVLRVVTYNIHYGAGILGEDNYDRIFDDILQTSPSVVILQEVTPAIQKRVVTSLIKAGFGDMHIYINVEKGEPAFCGNVIAVRRSIRMKHLKTLYLDGERNAIATRLKYNGHTVVIIGTHLDASHLTSKHREQQVRRINNFIDKEIAPYYAHYIVAGDMNESFGGRAVQSLLDPMGEVFRALKWTPPSMTCWAGTAIDQIFASPLMLRRLRGAYVYHSVNSDHMPVIADFAGFGSGKFRNFAS